MRRPGLLVVATALVALSCSGDNNPSQPNGNSGTTVTVGNNVFTPASITVPVNSTVTWQWNSGGVTHNVTFQDAATSGDKSSGSFPRIFATAGDFSYVCTIHASLGMSGVVHVTASTGGAGGTGGGSGAGGGGGYP